MPDLPHLAFASPRKLPPAASLPGRVVVLDLAFAADGMGTPFAEVTGRFLSDLGPRLAMWVDHHDHERHPAFAGDDRFVLATKAEHGGCPEMITAALVARAGPVGSLLAHGDLDGLYAAAKWLRGGIEPYPGADADARAVDTRIGTPGPHAERVDRALRARFRDDGLRRLVVRWLAAGGRDPIAGPAIEEAARSFAAMDEETARLSGEFRVVGRVAVVDADRSHRPFDKTELLLAGQRRAPVAIVRHSGNITIAAPFGSGYDFVRLLGLGGGMPTRVSLAAARLDDVLRRINEGA